jgi:hypothetical protein
MPNTTRRIGPVLAGLLLLQCPTDPRPQPGEQAQAKAADPADERGSSLQPPPRQPGPPRLETRQQVQAAQKEAFRQTRSLLEAGVPPREVASVADTRGYRLYRTRHLGQARAWFEAAVSVDRSFELSLYNAARCAALQGDHRAARRHLLSLQRLDTPLSRARMSMASQDPDLQSLRDNL